MSIHGSATTVIEGAHAQIEVGFAVDAGNALHLHYRLRNTGADALAVFDRGNRHAVLTKQQARGAVGVPFLREEGDGAVTLQHLAITLPSPAPTLPPTPLAVRLESGEALESEFTFAHWVSDPPRTLRWCLGIAPFDSADFHSPETIDGVEIWQASFACADRQQVLCTPWFDVLDGAFLAPG